MSLFKEKLNKNLFKGLQEHNFSEATELQFAALPKINSGRDVVIVGDNGSGKSLLATVSTINKLNYAFEDAPRALIIVSDNDKAIEMQSYFIKAAQYTDLRVSLATEAGKIEKQTDEIYFGTDVVICTVKRLMEIYIRRIFNLTKLKVFIIDDAELIAKQNVLSHLVRLSLSLPKCQRVIFCNELTEKVEIVSNKFTTAPVVVEL